MEQLFELGTKFKYQDSSKIPNPLDEATGLDTTLIIEATKIVKSMNPDQISAFWISLSIQLDKKEVKE